MITVDFDDGNSVECEILGIFELEDQEYIALANVENDDVYLYGYVEINDEEFELKEIPEEDFDKVADVYDAIMAEAEE